MTLLVAVVAPGAMGSAIAARIVAHGATVLTSLDGRSAATEARASAAGMRPASDAELAASDLVLSIVPPNQAVPLARRLAPALREAGRQPFYIDLNAIAPDTARSVGSALTGTGARYVDGSIIGGPPKADEPGPTLYLSGECGEAAAALGGLGLTVRTLDGGIGAASALKMTYAGLTKGLTALATAMILAARREGAAPALAAELASSQPELLARFRRAIPDMLPKAYRWAPEMEEIAAFLGPADPASGIYTAVAALYEKVAADTEVPSELTEFFKA